MGEEDGALTFSPELGIIFLVFQELSATDSY